MVSCGIRRWISLSALVPSTLLCLAPAAAYATPLGCVTSRSPQAAALGLGSCLAANNGEDLDEAWIPSIALPPPGYRAAFAPPVVSEEVWERIGGTGRNGQSGAFYQEFLIPYALKYPDLIFAVFDRQTRGNSVSQAASASASVITSASVLGDLSIAGSVPATGAAVNATIGQLALVPAEVPEPASLLLVGAGLILAGFRIRRLPHQ